MTRLRQVYGAAGEAPAFAGLRRGKRMTNSEGITKADAEHWLQSAIKQGSGLTLALELVIGAPLELGGWDLGFPQPAVVRQKTAAFEKRKLEGDFCLGRVELKDIIAHREEMIVRKNFDVEQR